MEKNIIERLIDAGIITEQDIDEYNRQKATGLINQQLETAHVQNNQAERYTYSKIENGVLVKFDERDLDKNGGYVTPVGVNAIAEYAFAGCDRLIKIVLRRDIMEIGESAFESCSNLKSVKMANRVRRMGENVFDSCINLTDVKLSSKLKYIPKFTFCNCINLQEIMLPEKLEVIENCAFGYCENLNIISTPTEHLLYVGELAFDSTPIGDDFMRKFKEMQEVKKQ